MLYASAKAISYFSQLMTPAQVAWNYFLLTNLLLSLLPLRKKFNFDARKQALRPKSNQALWI